MQGTFVSCPASGCFQKEQLGENHCQEERESGVCVFSSLLVLC